MMMVKTQRKANKTYEPFWQSDSFAIRQPYKQGQNISTLSLAKSCVLALTNELCSSMIP